MHREPVCRMIGRSAPGSATLAERVISATVKVRFTRLHHVTKVEETVTHVHPSYSTTRFARLRAACNHPRDPQSGGTPYRQVAATLRERRPSFVVLPPAEPRQRRDLPAYVMGAVNGMVVARAAPSLLTSTAAACRLRRRVIGISQSGKATDVIEVLDTAPLGAMTIALTSTAIAHRPGIGFPAHPRSRRKAVAATRPTSARRAPSARGVLGPALRSSASIHRAPEVIEQVFSELEPRIAARSGATLHGYLHGPRAGLTMPPRRRWASSSRSAV